MQGVRPRRHQPLLHAVPRIDLVLARLANSGRRRNALPVPLAVDMLMMLVVLVMLPPVMVVVVIS
jgi:hypothetical protein